MGKKILLLDTETTGLVSAKGANLDTQPYIIEFFGIIIDGKDHTKVSQFHTLIKPPIAIPPIITKITGIDDNTVKKAPRFSKVRKSIKKIIECSDMMIAQNLRFDYDMINIEFQREKRKVKFPINLFCTVEQSMHFRGFRLKSTELYQLAKGKEIQGIHRAEADVLAMIDYFEFITDPKNIPAYLRGR
jgi:DNA polymerase-3 subunit epsilon